MCPFSHEPMDSASAVDLRCGHRFALVRLGAAHHAAQLCCAAGFAQKDALICPLCGDQAGTSKPGAGKILTTYSANTDAYLGDLRKDWQKPLQLPMQATLGSVSCRSSSATVGNATAAPRWKHRPCGGSQRTESAGLA